MSNYSDSDFKDDKNTSWYKSFELVPTRSTVLDIGCSSGTFGAHLIDQKECTVDGVEIDEGDIAKAKKVLRKVYKLNIEQDELKIKTRYDVIFMGDVIEHLAHPTQTLSKVRELLKNNGLLVFSIPNITHLSVRLMLLSGAIEYGRTGLLDETHLHFYNQNEVYRILNEAGYKVEKFDFTVNDMPFELVEKELQKLGLIATKEFKNLVQSTNGAAYQFVGVAKKSTKAVAQALPQSSPANTVETFINELKSQYEATVDELLVERKKIITDLEKLAAEKDKLSRDLVAADKLPEFIKRKLTKVVRKLRKLKLHDK